MANRDPTYFARCVYTLDVKGFREYLGIPEKGTYYLVAFDVITGNGDSYMHTIVTEDENLAKRLEKARFVNDATCCGQTRCFGCRHGGYTVEWSNTLSGLTEQDAHNQAEYADFIDDDELFDSVRIGSDDEQEDSSDSDQSYDSEDSE